MLCSVCQHVHWPSPGRYCFEQTCYSDCDRCTTLAQAIKDREKVVQTIVLDV